MIYEVYVEMCRGCKQTKDSNTKFFGSRKAAYVYSDQLESECRHNGWFNFKDNHECRVWLACHKTPKTKEECMSLLEKVANRDK